jgi:hypothetical protein
MSKRRTAVRRYTALSTVRLTSGNGDIIVVKSHAPDILVLASDLAASADSLAAADVVADLERRAAAGGEDAAFATRQLRDWRRKGRLPSRPQPSTPAPPSQPPPAAEEPDEPPWPPAEPVDKDPPGPGDDDWEASMSGEEAT